MRWNSPNTSTRWCCSQATATSARWWKRLQRRGVHVTVVSTISSQPPMIADELRREADVFTDLVELKSKIARDPSERGAPPRTALSRAAISCSVRQRRRRGGMTTNFDD